MRIIIISNRAMIPVQLTEFLRKNGILSISLANPFIALTQLQPMQPDYVILFRDQMSSFSFNAFINNYWVYDKTLSHLILIVKHRELPSPLAPGLSVIPSDDTEHLLQEIERILLRNGENVSAAYQRSNTVLPPDEAHLLFSKVYIHIQSIRINTLIANHQSLLYSIDTLFNVLTTLLNFDLLRASCENLNQFIASISQICQHATTIDVPELDFHYNVAGYYKNTLLELSDGLTAANRLVSPKVAGVVQYINHNYMNPLTLKDVSELFSMSETYLSRSFKREMGVNFISYLSQTRIEAACLQLRFTGITTDHIAQSVGFTDPKYFIRVFRKQMGVTPKAYRVKCAQGN